MGGAGKGRGILTQTTRFSGSVRLLLRMALSTAEPSLPVALVSAIFMFASKLGSAESVEKA